LGTEVGLGSSAGSEDEEKEEVEESRLAGLQRTAIAEKGFDWLAGWRIE
jgi:hypothetical protein